MGALTGKKIAFFSAPEGVEEAELTVPWQALAEEGAQLEMVSLKPGAIQMFRHLDKSRTHSIDRVVTEARPDSYDALVLPGGVANPDAARQDPDAVAFVRAFVEEGKPVAAICHAPWMLVEAGVVEGRTLTSWPSLRTDITNAGGTWVDRDVVVDGNLVTSRKPDDLPAFCSAVIAEVSGTRGASGSQRRSA